MTDSRTNLRVRISADLADIKQGLGLLRGEMAKTAAAGAKSGRDMAAGFGGMNSAITGLRNQLVGFAAAFVSVQTVFRGFTNAIDQADKLNDFTQRLGVSAEAISSWGYIASQTGTDIETLGKGLRTLQKNMAEALDPKSEQANLFKALGIDVKEFENNIEGLLPVIADHFKTLDNDTQETALAMQLFGKSGADLLEFLNLGSEGMDEFIAKARDLGIVLSQETLSAADDFNDAIGDLQTATQGAMYQALEPLLPLLRDLVGEMTAFAKTGDGAKQAGQDAATGISEIVNAASKANTFLVSLREGLSALEQQARGYTTLALGGGASSIAQIEQSAKRLDAVFDGSFAKSQEAAAASSNANNIVVRTNFKSLEQQAKDIAEAIKQRKTLQDAVNKYLGDPTGTGAGSDSKAKRRVKSEAERDAEKEAKRQAQAQADEIDEVNRLIDDQVDAYNEARASVEQYSADIQFDTEVTRLNGLEKERAIALSQLHADATDAEREQVLALVDANYRAREAAAVTDEVKSSLVDLAVDAADSYGSAGDEVENFVDRTRRAAMSLLAEKAVQYLITLFTGSGSAGSIFDFQSSAANGFGFHRGGIVGQNGSLVKLLSFMDGVNPDMIGAPPAPPSYHSGGFAGLANNEVMAVLLEGEEVLTEQDPRHTRNGGRHRRGGGGAVPVEVHVHKQGNGDGPVSATAAMESGKVIVHVTMAEAIRQAATKGSPLNRAIRAGLSTGAQHG